jgi:hypothetical protein
MIFLALLIAVLFIWFKISVSEELKSLTREVKYLREIINLTQKKESERETATQESKRPVVPEIYRRNKINSR